MRSTFRHHHPCQDCAAKTPCDGSLADNYDGSPEIVCDDFHLIDGRLNPDFICEACEFAREDAANERAQREVIS